MIKIVAIAVAAAVAFPAIAPAQDINHQSRIGAALRAGCHVQQVHTPAGKLVHSAPIVHCPADRSDTAVEARQRDAREPARG